MKIRNKLLTALLAGLLVGSAQAAATAKAPVDAKNPENSLKLAMAADTVIQIMGKPESVTPMKSDKGKAEIWEYRRQVGDRMDVVVLTTPVMSPVPDGNQSTRMVATGERVDNHEEHHITTELVDLLMFNNHFVTAKVSRTEAVRIDD
jgi:hypothetical protein